MYEYIWYCVHVNVSVWVMYVFLCSQEYVMRLSICIWACLYVYVVTCVYEYVCMSIYSSVCMCVFMKVCVCETECVCAWIFSKELGIIRFLYYSSVGEILTLIFHILVLKLTNVECVILDQNRDSRSNSKIKPRNNLHVNHYIFSSVRMKISKNLPVMVHLRIPPIWKVLDLESPKSTTFFFKSSFWDQSLCLAIGCISEAQGPRSTILNTQNERIN